VFVSGCGTDLGAGDGATLAAEDPNKPPNEGVGLIASKKYLCYVINMCKKNGKNIELHVQTQFNVENLL
jgi:hypothetical protein